MKKPVFASLALIAALSQSFALEFKATKDFVRLPDVNSRPTNQHGDVAVSAKGEIYVSTMDPDAGIQVFSPDGKFLRNVPGAPNDFHGFVLRKDLGEEYIFGPRLEKQSIIKMTLDGKVVMEIPASAIPDKFKNVRGPNTKKNAQGEIPKNPDEGKTFLRMTGIDVAPNGDIYVTDGYASDHIHRFDRSGKYISTFGGKKEPYGFKTLHKLAVDTRFTPARLIVLDRLNSRAIHLTLEGEIIGVVAKDLLLPSAIAVQGEYAVIGELKGQVTVLDKEGKIVTKFGTNTKADEASKNTPEPTKWVAGTVTAPHGVTFTAKGDVLVSEYNIFGRVHHFVRQ